MKNFITLEAQAAAVRTEKYNGKDYLVVPVVALVEQVLHSANAETPNLALSEEFSKVPAGWNGRPVVVNHPQKNGNMVSANSPDILETEKIGEIFNSKVEDDKLKMEAWIDTAKAEELGGVIWDTVQRLQSGKEVVEISTGLFADVEDKSGEIDGKKYDGVWRNIVPDHLAILSAGSIGACSVDDGCGAPRVNNGSCGAGCKCAECVAQRNPESQGMLEKFINAIFNRTKRSDVDKRKLLQAALVGKVGKDSGPYVEAVYNKTVVYSTWDGYFEIGYSIGKDDSVTFDQTAVAVVPEVSYSPIKVNEKEVKPEVRSNVMDKEVFVNALIANKASKFEESDKEWLMAQDEKVLEKLEPEEVKPAVAETEAEKPAVKEPENNSKAPATTEEFLNQAPEGIRSVLNEALKTQAEKRTGLIADIKANKQNVFTDAELDKMDTTQLEKLSKLAVSADYAGRGSVRQVKGEEPLANTMPEVFPKKVA